MQAQNFPEDRIYGARPLNGEVWRGSRWWACDPSWGTLSRRVPGGLPLPSQPCEVLQCKQVLFQGPGGVDLMPEVHKEEKTGGPGAPGWQPHLADSLLGSQRGHSAWHTVGAQEIFIEQENKLTAPVRKGQVVGKIEVKLKEEIVKHFDIVCAESVERKSFRDSLFYVWYLFLLH